MRMALQFIDPGKAVAPIVAALAAARARGDRTTIPSVFTETSQACVRRLPPWVARVAVLKSRATWWLWCEPRTGTRGGGGQMVLDVPPGRYLVDTLDTRACAWFSRESAAAAPLVAGLASSGHTVVVRVRRVSATTTTPRE
jgi:hypothetical protein